MAGLRVPSSRCALDLAQRQRMRVCRHPLLPSHSVGVMSARCLLALQAPSEIFACAPIAFRTSRPSHAFP